MSEPYIRPQINQVKIKCGGATDGSHSDKAITFVTSMASKGGGDSKVRVAVPAEDFATVLRHMLTAAPRETIKAFAEAVRDTDLAGL